MKGVPDTLKFVLVEEDECDEICDIMSTPVAELEMRESLIKGLELPISTLSTGAGYIISIPGLKWTKIHDEALRERIHSFVVGEIDFLKQFTSEQNYNPFQETNKASGGTT